MSQNGRPRANVLQTGSEGNLDHNDNIIALGNYQDSTDNASSTVASSLRRNSGPEYQMASNGSSPDNSSFRRFEVGESSRTGAQVGNPRPSIPPIIDNSAMRFFEYNMMATSMPHIQIGMGMSSTWAPHYLVSRSNFNANNTHQHMRILPPGHYVLQSAYNNNIVPAMGSSSTVHPSPFGLQPNQFPPMFRNQLLLSVARNNTTGNLELILTSRALELRNDRNRLRDQILRAQEQLRNSGPGTTEDLLISEYSMALNMLDEQERLDEEEERLEQLEGDAWRYETERALEEEEIIARIMHEDFRSNLEDTENEKCAICQEELVDGEHIGRLDCNHMFHFECIKEWLMQKNACPICKQTALYFPSSDDESDG